MVLLTCLTTYRLARCNKSLRNLSAFAVMGLRCQIVILSGLILLRQGSWHRPLRTQLPIPFPISDKLAGFRLLSVWLVGCHRQKKNSERSQAALEPLSSLKYHQQDSATSYQ